MSQPDPSHQQKNIVLVTGASRGIGRAAALQLIGRGFHVIALARSEEALLALDDEARSKYAASLSLLPMDLKDLSAIDGIAASLLERFGRLDGLLANAGLLGPLGPLSHIRPREFEAVLTVNLLANWRLIRALDPLLRASPCGHAVFVTSRAASSAPAYWGAYAAAKAGLEAMICSYAQEVTGSTLRVNLFDPGPTSTAMRKEAMPGEDPSILSTPVAVARQLTRLFEPNCHDNGKIFRFDSCGESQDMF